MTTCVSGGTCMSRSSLREGTSEGESDALFGKGSGSHSRFIAGGRLRCHGIGVALRRRKLAEQAVALEALDFNRQNPSDNGRRCHHMGRLEISGTADNLARIAGRALKQHVHSLSNRGLDRKSVV